MHNGLFGFGSTEPEDWTLFRDWLAFTGCGLSGIRRALILDGNSIAAVGADPVQGLATTFCHETLGFTSVDLSYGELNDDEAYCVALAPAAGALFEPLAPGVALFGSGCPQEYDYGVLGLHPGVTGALGNLRYHSYLGTGTQSYVDFAQVVRRNVQPGTANWMSVVNGFSAHLLSERGCGGEDCSADSACRAAGMRALYGPLFDWLEDPALPFGPWRSPCVDTGVAAEPTTHLTGPATFLHAARPNPFHRRATIRFSLGSAQTAALVIHDVGGRRVRTLLDHPLQAGEHTVVWDGTDAGGHPAGGGVYWVQLRTEEGFRSSRRLLLLK